MSSISETINHIRNNSPQFASMYNAYQEALQRWSEQDVLQPKHIQGKRVLDWECGTGIFTALFLEQGAVTIKAIDSWLDTDYVQSTVGTLPNVQFEQISLQQFATDQTQHGCFDVIFANTVTEHMLDLPRLLPLCYTLLDTNGILILNHDNYYQPVGSHDHGFLNYGDRGEIEFQGPRCWEHVEKCTVSADFRQSIGTRFPWTWNDWTESQLTPENCRVCPYYRRAQPWSHLLYQREFRQVFPQTCFTTGYSNSSLNKVTPFQLQQFLVEAGFDIERWVPNKVFNQPPQQLLEPPFNFSAEDLCTATIAIRCRKGPLPSYHILES